jgi:hypothetical protein
LPAATASVDGYETKEQVTKLDGIAAGAKVGDVVGPASSFAGHFLTFVDTTGKLVQDGGAVPLPVIYGSGIGLDGVANTQVGGPDGTPGRKVSVRFRASTNSALASLRFYKQGNAGYAGGTGGSLTVSIEGDDGTSSHLPDGNVLATQTVVTAYANPEPGKLVTFATPATLVAGTLYHVVFVNADAAPATNFVSVNALNAVVAITPRQPLYSDIDWALLLWDTGGDWWVRPDYTPIVSFAYANGQTAGQGYMEIGYPDYAIDGTAAVRETFIVTGGDRTVSTVGVRIWRTTGAGALTLTFKTSAGSVVASATIPAASIITGGYGGWVTATFATPFKLADGATYYFILTTAAGTTYTALPIRKGSDYGHPTSSYFKDGHAEQAPDGTTWADVAGDAGEYDLQFYFNVISAAITPAGTKLITAADAAAQIATLGLDADIATLSLPANTTITAAGAAILDDATATNQRATLGLGNVNDTSDATKNAAAVTVTNHRFTRRVDTQATTDTITPEISTYDIFIRTAQAHALVINNHSSSTPVDGDMILFEILSDATVRAITYGDKYVAKAGVALPAATVASKNLTMLFIWRVDLTQWVLLSAGQEA